MANWTTMKAPDASPIKGMLLRYGYVADTFGGEGEWRWTAGSDKITMDINADYLAYDCGMAWREWRDKKVVNTIVYQEGTVFPVRSELGSVDCKEWELSKNNKPVDPWVLEEYCYLRDNEGNRYTY